MASSSLLATLGLGMCGAKAAQKAAATTMSTSAQELEAAFFALAGAASSFDMLRLTRAVGALH